MRIILSAAMCISLGALALWCVYGRLERPEARPIEVYPYSELTKLADLVVIATLDSEKADRKQPGESELTERDLDVECLLAKFKVEATLKGTSPGETLILKHYRLDEKSEKNRVVMDGPCLASFHKSRTYLLFLNKRKDGMYQCVTGFMDPVFSVCTIEYDHWENLKR
jgi:hypothetical protein